MAEPKYLGSEEFRQSALDAMTAEGKELVDVMLRNSFDTEVKAGDGESRTLNFTISTGSADRHGDTVSVKGWKLDAYRKDPVVLWAHDSTKPPIAKATRVWIEGEKLKAQAEFVPADNPAVGRFAEGILQLYKGGFLTATSVGFAPLKYSFSDDPERKYGIDFKEQELLEFSAVPVPANAEALIEGKSAGIDISPVLDWAEDMMKQDAERVLRLADGILSKSKDDAALLAWAEKVLGANGKACVSKERIERIERAATQQRLAAKRQRELDLIRIRGRQAP